MPQELAEALLASPKALILFEGLPSLQRANHIAWVAGTSTPHAKMRLAHDVVRKVFNVAAKSPAPAKARIIMSRGRRLLTCASDILSEAVDAVKKDRPNRTWERSSRRSCGGGTVAASRPEYRKAQISWIKGTPVAAHRDERASTVIRDLHLHANALQRERDRPR